MGLGPPTGNMERMMPKMRKITAVQAIGVERAPVWKGPGLNLCWPQTTRAKMGMPQARLLPYRSIVNKSGRKRWQLFWKLTAIAKENTAWAAAGAMSVSKPRRAARMAQPQIVRSGM